MNRNPSTNPPHHSVLAKWAGLLLLWAGLFLGGTGCKTRPPAPAPVVFTPGYMRVTHPDTNTVALEVALKKFTPASGKGPAVWLVGASHLGSSNYYAGLQTELDAQTLVLYEGIKYYERELTREQRRNWMEAARQQSSHSLQSRMAHALGLLFQLEAVDYDRDHFRNSDLTVNRMQTLLAEEEAKARAAGKAGGGGDALQNLLQLMQGNSAFTIIVNMGLTLVGSNPKMQALTRLAMIEIIGQVGEKLDQAAGLPEEIQQLLRVLIQERNKAVLADLQAALPSQTGGSIAIFYGCGHMADLERRLQNDLHYQPAQEKWLAAFSVNTVQAGLSAGEIATVQSLVKWQLDSLAGK